MAPTLGHELRPPADPRRVVVLGAHGFIGRALVRALGDLPVLAPRSDAPDLAADGASARLAAALEPHDSVVMLAARTADRGNDARSLVRNCAMGFALAEAIRARRVAHVVYLSSEAVYPAYTDPEHELTEASCAEPRDPYAAMHRVREEILLSQRDVPVLIVRCVQVFGPANEHDVYGPNRFCRQATEQGAIELFGDGEEIRDFLFVDDLAALIREALRSRSSGVVNAASGEPLCFAELAQRIARLVARPVAIRSAPRRQPVGHRRYDVSARRRGFPALEITALEHALRTLLRSDAQP